MSKLRRLPERLHGGHPERMGATYPPSLIANDQGGNWSHIYGAYVTSVPYGLSAAMAVSQTAMHIESQVVPLTPR